MPVAYDTSTRRQLSWMANPQFSLGSSGTPSEPHWLAVVGTVSAMAKPETEPPRRYGLGRAMIVIAVCVFIGAALGVIAAHV